ncbi:MAG: hypothetical protein KatS3mg019_2480 [Fimbriimonadales bacterium]|nr:MAG: hypothetical protein KatS3mg019_2480 [Fimbriimonadales bacterium]
MQQSTNGTAVASLVLGILALVMLLSVGVFWGCLPAPLVFGILAWILGKSAASQIDAGIGNPNDRGLATAGYVMGVIAVALSVLALCCWMSLGGATGLAMYSLWNP